MYVLNTSYGERVGVFEDEVLLRIVRISNKIRIWIGPQIRVIRTMYKKEIQFLWPEVGERVINQDHKERPSDPLAVSKVRDKATDL